jgi:hypothetical protein
LWPDGMRVHAHFKQEQARARAAAAATTAIDAARYLKAG